MKDLRIPVRMVVLREVAVEKRVRVPPPRSDPGAGAGRIHFIFFDTFIFLGGQVIKKNKMLVHGFWLRARCGPIFYLGPPRGRANIFLVRNPAENASKSPQNDAQSVPKVIPK